MENHKIINQCFLMVFDDLKIRGYQNKIGIFVYPGRNLLEVRGALESSGDANLRTENVFFEIWGV